jgi:predicted dehydrogenase
MLTIGYIGNGKSTNRYHLPFVLLRKNIKVKTVFSPHAHTSPWKKVDNIIYTEDVKDVMEDPEIQVVVVCTTHHFHYEYAKMALEHGKHVLVEKPFMTTTKEAKEIFDFAREKGLVVQCFQNRRYDSDFLTVQKVIERGKLGDLLEVEMHFDYYRPEIPENVHEYKFYDSYLYGHGCHTLDQVLSYFGKPEDIRYDVRQLLGPNRMNDYFDLDLFYGNLKVSVKSSYFRIKERPSFIVYGKKGMFVKQTKDRQEEHLKLFYMPGQPDFGYVNP